jgi:hypothetical protein
VQRRPPEPYARLSQLLNQLSIAFLVHVLQRVDPGSNEFAFQDQLAPLIVLYNGNLQHSSIRFSERNRRAKCINWVSYLFSIY